ncbi:YbdK family carboxylate-amine ligase [Leifsonia shinshuensis]|uniref:Putative glutamate--cysteine ligase 2 n=1 Tax=Leifsonia shinshuensis TaxID=150026 RepID=A0A853CUZ4_9MICO|nr:carboxylate-amine ligase [Leifsonia shinshuensis]
MATTIGAEEEFILLDPISLTPVERATEARTALADPDRDGEVMAEFFPSQLEYASPVCSTAAELGRSLSGFRGELAGWAREHGVIGAGVGVPFDVTAGARVTDLPRYRDIANDFGRITADHQISGLHVHVGTRDRDSAIRALNRVRPWLPTLLALSANSPFWEGADTGFDSWRAIHSRRWTTHGIPPAFRDPEDYARRTAALGGIGGTSDAGTLNWVVRPSEKYPTLEVRAFDAQLDVRTSTALAVLVRGMVDAGHDEPAHDAELLDAAYWHAARYGLDQDLFDPRSGRLRPAADVVHALLAAAGPGLKRHGDVECVGSVVDGILEHGNGATRQRRAYRDGGAPALAELLDAATRSDRAAQGLTEIRE